MRKALITLAIAVVVLAALPVPIAVAEEWPTPSGPNGVAFLDTPRFKTHSLRWSTKISDLPSGIYPMSPLLAYQGKVFVNGAGTDSVLALDAKTGEVVWRFQPDPRRSGSFGGYPNPNEPYISGGIYYTTATNGILYALDTKTGKKLWSFQVTTTDYNKAIAKVSVCGNRVFMDVLGGIPDQGQHNIYALDAKSGKKLWSTYAGSPDWPGDAHWPDLPKNPTHEQKLSTARSTRRFEAMPGVTCHGDRIYFFAEDGVLRVLDVANGKQVGAYDVAHAGDIGGAVDGASGITDPQTGDLVRNSLNNRMVRLKDESLETACAGQQTHPLRIGLCTDPLDEDQKVHEGWRNIYGSCVQPGGKVCGALTDPTRSDVLGTYTDRRNDGIIGGATFSGGIGIGTWPSGRRVVYAPNHDGYLYAIDFDNPAADKGPIWRAPMGSITKALRDGAYSERPGGEDLYTSNDGAHCKTAANCQNGPWEHRASNVAGPAIAGGVVYAAGSMDHAMYGFDMVTGEQVLRFEVTWDDKAQYPPFGDTKPKPFVDLDLLIQSTPAADGSAIYFSANNGVVYAIDTQRTIRAPQKNLAILGSGVVPFIPKWKEAIGAFDYVWTPQGDWYNPGYKSARSVTANQAPPGFQSATTPFGYKGLQEEGWLPGPLQAALAALLLLLLWLSARGISSGTPLSLHDPPMLSRPESIVESLEAMWARRSK